MSGLETLFPELARLKRVVYLAGELRCIYQPGETIDTPEWLAPSIGWHEDECRDAIALMLERGWVRQEGDRLVMNEWKDDE